MIAVQAIHVHDSVLPDPWAYRAKALAQRFQTVQDGIVQFQGIAPCADPRLPMWLVQHYPRLEPVTSFFRSSPLGQEEPHAIHTDTSMGAVTALLYLNPAPPVGDGTKFFRHRDTWEILSRAEAGSPEWHTEAVAWFDPEQWECWQHIEAKFNRLVIFPSAFWHSRAILENYGTDPDSARLLQVVFCDGALL